MTPCDEVYGSQLDDDDEDDRLRDEAEFVGPDDDERDHHAWWESLDDFDQDPDDQQRNVEYQVLSRIDELIPSAVLTQLSSRAVERPRGGRSYPSTIAPEMTMDIVFGDAPPLENEWIGIRSPGTAFIVRCDRPDAGSVSIIASGPFESDSADVPVDTVLRSPLGPVYRMTQDRAAASWRRHARDIAAALVDRAFSADGHVDVDAVVKRSLDAPFRYAQTYAVSHVTGRLGLTSLGLNVPAPPT